MTKRIRDVMVDLTALRQSPLGKASFGNANKVLIKEIPFLKSFDLRVEPNTPDSKKVESALEITLPLKVGTIIKKDFSCLTLGPDWWLLVELSEAKADSLISTVKNDFVSLVDVSSQRTCIEVSGVFAKEVLQHAWEQDLDDVGLPIDSCSQGLMARCPTIVHRTAPTTYCLYVRSSFAQHLFKFLTDAATEYLK